MLKYEERLHFDQHNERLSEGVWSNRAISVFWCLACYFLIYYLIRRYCSGVPDICAWSSSQVWCVLYGITITYADGIYFIVGLVLMCYGSLRLSEITKQNHSVRDKASDTPDKLLTIGCYSQIRHPMYGIFVIMYSSVFIAFHSAVGIIIIALLYVLQVINAVIEERHKLIPRFGNEYCEYRSRVRNLIFSKQQVALFIALIVVTIIGLLF